MRNLKRKRGLLISCKRHRKHQHIGSKSSSVKNIRLINEDFLIKMFNVYHL